MTPEEIAALITANEEILAKLRPTLLAGKQLIKDAKGGMPWPKLAPKMQLLNTAMRKEKKAREALSFLRLVVKTGQHVPDEFAAEMGLIKIKPKYEQQADSMGGTLLSDLEYEAKQRK
jgi:hypothetical protein